MKIDGHLSGLESHLRLMWQVKAVKNQLEFVCETITQHYVIRFASLQGAFQKPKPSFLQDIHEVKVLEYTEVPENCDTFRILQINVASFHL
jgi:hypothetical protein